MDSNWVKIFSTSENYKAELVKGLLQENGIECIVVNKQDSAYLFGELELYVQADFAVRANHILTTNNEI